MTDFYGVDSVTPAQQVVPVLKRAWGGLPSFWCRYIGANYNIDAAEIAYLLSLGIRVAFVFNLRAGVQFPLIGSASGRADAMQALGILDTLCPGKKPLVFRDIESGQPVDTNYLAGWCAALGERAWPGGFYGPGSQPYFASTYAPLAATVNRRFRLFWNANWIGYIPPSHQPVWAPNVCPGIPAGDVVLWQFAGDVPQLNRLVDCNLATQEAYDLMLGAPAPKPPPLVWHALHTAALKPEPTASHTTPSIHTVYGGDICTPTGKTQTVVSPITARPEEWWEVSTTGKDGRTYTGFILKANLYEDDAPVPHG